MRTPKMLILVVLLAQFCNALYLPGSHMHSYSAGEAIYAKVNSLTSDVIELPFSYYSLSHCNPAVAVGEKKSAAEHLGEGYRIRMNTSEAVFLCTTPPLSEQEVKLLKQRTRDLYEVDMMLNKLPLWSYAETNGINIRLTGFPQVPEDSKDDYILNHLKFKVLVHKEKKKATGYVIGGFEVVPSSVKYDPQVMAKLHMYDTISPPLNNYESQIIREQERVSFTYEVEFVKSYIRWKALTDEDEDDILVGKGTLAHFFSIFLLFMFIIFMGVMGREVFLRTVLRHQNFDEEEHTQMIKETSWLKHVAGDVFREPDSSKLLCVMVGDGVQITGMAAVTIVLAALGFISPASREMLLTEMITFYLLLGIVGGYVSVRLWKTIKGSSCSEGWMSVSLLAACFFPGTVIVILTPLNFLEVTTIISLYDFLVFLSLWLCISVPLSLLGGLLGTRAEAIQYPPVRTNNQMIPREIPASTYPLWLLHLGTGILPFGALYFEVHHIFSCIWRGHIYSTVGFQLILMMLLGVGLGEVSIIITYMYMRMEDWRWWWKAFLGSGSIALYVFLYSIKYLVYELHSLREPLSTILYLCYSLIMTIAVMLSTGSIGFFVSFYYLYNVFSTEKFH